MRSSLFIIVLLSIVSLVLCDNRGYLLIHKQLNTLSNIPHLYAVDEPIIVNITVYNVGDSAAYSVAVSDEWPTTFELTRGSLKGAFEEIASGGRVSYNFTVIPRESSAGIIETSRAHVRYQSVIDGTDHTAYSNNPLNVTILTAERYQKLTAKHFLEWTIFSTISLLAIFLPLLSWLNIQNNNKHGLPNSFYAHSKDN